MLVLDSQFKTFQKLNIVCAGLSTNVNKNTQVLRPSGIVCHPFTGPADDIITYV